MKLKQCLLAALAVVGLAGPALAQPASPPDLKIMAPAGPGGGWDTAARSIQQV